MKHLPLWAILPCFLVSCQPQIIEPPPSPTDSTQIPPPSPPTDTTPKPPVVSFKKKLPTSIKVQGDTGAAYYYNYYYDSQNRLISLARKGADSLIIGYNGTGKVEYIYSYSSTVITNKSIYYYSGTSITDSAWYLVNGAYKQREGYYYTLNTKGQLNTLLAPAVTEQRQYSYDTIGNVVKIDYKKSSCSGGICYSSSLSYENRASIYYAINTPTWFLIGLYSSGKLIFFPAFNNANSSSGYQSNTYTTQYDADNYPSSIRDNKNFITYTLSYQDGN